MKALKTEIIQTKQNKLYNFLGVSEQINKKEAIAKNCDMIITSKAINYAGLPEKVDCLYEELIPEMNDSLFQELGGLAKQGNAYLVAGAMAVPYEMDIEGLRTPSEVISPEGEIIIRGPNKEAGVVICEINPLDCKSIKEMRIGDRKPATYEKGCKGYFDHIK